MGLDASAKFFYGMPLAEAYDVLRWRDEEKGKRRCLKCKAVVESKFCPDDGEGTEPIEPKIGIQDLCEGDYGPLKDQMKGLELVCLDHEDEGAYYLAVVESLKKAGDLRGDGAGAVPLGQSITSNMAWDALLKEFCKVAEIKFVGAQFYFGLYLSY